MRKAMFWKKLICVLVILGAVALSATACALFPDEENVEIPVLKTPKPVEYSLYKVARGTIETGSSGIGTVSSVYYTRAAFRNSGGYVSKFNVNIGDTVNEGDILVELDNNALSLQLEEAEINYELQKLSYEDTCSKYPDGSVYIRQAALNLKKVENVYLAIKETYENTILRAPVSGVVVYINTKYSTGNSQVVAGETVVAIDTLDKKYLYVTFSKTLEALNNPSLDPPEEFRVGTNLKLQRLTVDVEEEAQFDGVVVSDSSIIEDTGIGYVSSATYYVKMINPPEDIASGNTVKYIYTEAVSEDCLYIPISAYSRYDGKTYVYILDDNNLKVEKYVEIGLENSTYAEVLSGLEEGDVIVLG